MRTEQKVWHPDNGWSSLRSGGDMRQAQLALIFGSGEDLRSAQRLAEIRASYPTARLVTCSTAGEINNASQPGLAYVEDNSLVVTALQLEHSTLQCAATTLAQHPDAHAAGRHLGNMLPHAGLRWVLMFADGMQVNGSKLLAGLQEGLPPGTGVSGGMAGDEFRMQHTFVGLDEVPQEGVIVIIGFYGERLRFGYGTYGGWDPFGPERHVTRARDNILYELDGEPALEVYKRYLGDSANALPLSALLFPLSIRDADQSIFLRGVAAVDEAAKSLTLFGDIPQGAHARLMRFNPERIIDGAEKSAAMSLASMGSIDDGVAIAVSCMGRRLVLKQRTEEEVETLRTAFVPGVTLTGFYSYGELSPSPESGLNCLHNYTMTITLVHED